MEKIKRFFKTKFKFQAKSRFWLVFAVGVFILLSAGGGFWWWKNSQNKINYSIKRNIFGGEAQYQNNNQDFQIGFLSKKERNVPEISFSRGEVELKMKMTEGGTEKVKLGKYKMEKNIAGHDELLLQDVLPQTDLTYAVIEKGVKEDIILKSKEALKNFPENIFYRFEFDAQGAKAGKLEKIAGKEVPIFYDEKGNYVFHFLPLVMLDGKGEKSEALKLQLEKAQDGHYRATIFPDRAWLEKVGRVFPVRIDPSIVHDESSEFSGGNFSRTIDGGSGSAPKVQAYYKAATVDQSTIGLWHLDETSGSTVNDSSGKGNTGTATGTTIVDGKFSKGRGFDGTNGNYITIPITASLQPQNNLTLQAWVFPNSTYAGDMIMVGQGAYYLTIQNDWSVQAYWYGKSPAGYHSSGANTVIPNQWNLITATWDNDAVRIYVNGILKNTVSTSGIGSQATGQIWIGAEASGTTRKFNGQIDEVKISNVARTPEEIKADAQRRPYGTFTSSVIDTGDSTTDWQTIAWTENGVATGDGETPYSSTGLVAHWKFNETSGTTASDSSGNSRNGTLTNFSNTTGQDALAGSGWTANNGRWPKASPAGLMFDGTDDKVVISSGLDGLPVSTSDITLSFWVFQKVSTNNSVFAATPDESTNRFSIHLCYPGAGGNKIFWDFGDTSGAGRLYADVCSSEWLNKWVHYAFVSQTGVGQKIYRNGVEVASDATAGTFTKGTKTLEIGTGLTYFNGVMDSVQLYSRALTGEEILSNYNASNIEIQTRSGTDATPEDGGWEDWKPSGSGTETAVLTMDSDAANWNVAGTQSNPGVSCSDILGKGGSTGDGLYYINPLNATPFQVYCDMTTDGGGWTLVLNNSNGAVTPPKPTWSQVVNDNNVTGTFGTNLTIFDQFLGVKYWNAMGNQMRLTQGASPSSLSHKATYNFSLNASNNYALSMSNESVLISTTGTASSGMYTYHAASNYQLTTYDADHDVGGSNCATNYGNTAWWYGACWSGSFWGGGDSGSYQNAPFWTGSGAEYFTWGGVWVRDPAKAVFPLKKSNISAVKTEGAGSMKVNTGYAQADPNTLALWHLEETGGADAYLRDAVSGIPRNNVAAYWKLDESGASLSDATGSGNTATDINGTAQVAGKITSARSFNGSNSYLDVPSATALKYTGGNFSVSLWTYINSSESTGGQIISRPWNGGGEYNYRIVYNASGTISVALRGSTDFATETSQTVSKNAWHHIAFTVDSAKNMKIYVDGVLAKSDTHNITSWTPVSGDANMPLCIGTLYPYGVGWGGNTGFTIDGLIDEVGIWNKTLLQKDIDDIYQNGQGQIFANYGGNHGTPTGTTLANGIAGKARSFAGSGSSIITVPDSSNFTFGTGDFSVETWVNPSVINGNYEGILGTYNGNGFMLTTSYGTDGHIAWWNVANGWIDSGISLDLNAWQHLAVTRTSGQIKIYKNGTLVSTTDGWTGSIDGGDLIIGGWHPSYAYLTGSLDEVRISSVARTSEEIAENYRMGRDHRISRTISSTDFSSKSKLPFYVAADRPGSYLEATVGESAFANYEPDTNTVGLWHLDEASSSLPSYFDYDNFETGAGGSDDWLIRNSVDPDVTSSTAYTGKYSLHMPTSWGQNFESGAGEPTTTPYDANTYPYMCMAYKIPAATTSNMLILLNGTWRSITMTQGEAPTSYPKVASWNPLIADSLWHYKCIDLNAQITASIGAGAHNIAAVIWHDGGGLPAITGEFWIDDFIISTSPFYPNLLPIKDSSSSGNSGQPLGTTLIQGKIGKGRNFDGNSFVLLPANLVATPSQITLSMWINFTSSTAQMMALSVEGGYVLFVNRFSTGSITPIFDGSSGNGNDYSYGSNLNDGNWHHIAATNNGTLLSVYVDGQLAGTASESIFNVNSSNDTSAIGAQFNGSSVKFNGQLDEIRIDNIARTASEIRQAYEVGKRTHTITIDFSAKLDAGNLIANSSDLSFTIDTTASGSYLKKGENLFSGDKIIIKENYDGTEYIAQGTVDSVDQTTGAVTITAWDSGATFPTSGFTANATVFKWQREYMDLTGALPSQIDGTTKITLRETDGNEGRNIWLDDFKSTSSYLTNPSSSTIDSANGRYLQYRTIFSSTDQGVSPYLSAVTLNYDVIPAAPTNISATDGTYTDKVTISWTKSTNATGYRVYRDGVQVGGDLGDVATFDDTGANPPTITGGATSASDGTNKDYVALNLSGASISAGTTHSYTVIAFSPAGASSASTENSGYRGTATLNYQWQRSAAASDANYSDITSATTASYNDTGAPSDGLTRYYRCVLTSTDAVSVNSSADSGYVNPYPVVSTVPLTNVAEVMATAQGNIADIGNSNVTTRGFKYGLTQADTWDINETGTFSAGAFSLPLTGLTAKTQYFIRAYATNSYGTAYGEYRSFYTGITTAPVELKGEMELKYNVEVK